MSEVCEAGRLRRVTRRLRTGPVYVLLVGIAISFAVLLTPGGGDGSYSCRGDALEDLINPEPEMGATFRREVAFDAGWQCNRDARFHGVVAAGLLVPFALGSATWTVVRRRSGMAK